MSHWSRRVPAMAALVALSVFPGCSGSQSRRADTLTPAVDRSAEADALVRRADAAAASGNSVTAVSLYQQAISLDGTRYVAWNNIGVELMKQGNYLDAVAAFKVASDLSPRDPRPASNIGLAYQEMGWAQDALQNFDEALRRDPNFLDALRGAAVAEDTLGFASLQSLNRVRQTLMIEKDEQWREFFQRRRFRIESQLRQPDA